jgi:hypothetical protein
MSVSALNDVGALENIPPLQGRPTPYGVRMDRFRANLNYFQNYSNYLSGKLGKK